MTMIRGTLPLGLIAIFAGTAAGCADEVGVDADPLALGRRYVEDRAYRRQVLEESVVNPDNVYSVMRLDNYAIEWRGQPAGWDGLPLWNPPVRPVTVRDIGSFRDDPYRPSREDEGTLTPVWSGEVEWTHEALVALGKRAFETWPVQLDMELGRATQRQETIDRFGLWVDDRGHVGGVVRVALHDGSERFATTCAGCHADVDERGRLVHGSSSHALDRGAILHWAATDGAGTGGAGTDGPDTGGAADLIASYLEWGRGRVDVTNDGVVNAASITDLFAVPFQSHLHWAGTLRNGLIPLAIRIETLCVTSSHAVVRSPREIAFAMALYLHSLAAQARAPNDSDEPVGAALFRRHCANCHHADGHVSAPIAIDVVGTDPDLGASTARGTGHYRVPSLWGVARRRALLHDRSVASLEELLDGDRLEQTPGHTYGLDLDEPQRAALLRYVRAIGAE